MHPNNQLSVAHKFGSADWRQFNIHICHIEPSSDARIANKYMIRFMLAVSGIQALVF